MVVRLDKRGSCITDTEPNLASVIETWQVWLQHSKCASARTRSAYGQDLAAFLSYFKKLRKDPLKLQHLQTMTAEDFQAYCEFCLAKSQAASSVARTLCALRNFFSFLKKEGLVTKIALDQIAAPPISKREPKSLSIQEIRKALQTLVDLSDEPWLAKRDLALFGLLYGAGLRLGEALSLNRDDIFDKDIVVISGSKGKVRRVLLPLWVANGIADYLAVCPITVDPQKPLFLGISGKRLNPGVVQRQMRRLRGILGFSSEVTPHTLRRSFALHRHVKGDDIHTIQDLLGHTYTSTTLRCLKPYKS
jgi:integrase/recombinase XerC